MPDSYILQEDDLSKLVLEDSSGFLLLEEAPIVVPGVSSVPPVNVTSIIQAFYDKLTSAFCDEGIIVYSGFQNRDRMPYIHLMRLSTVLENRDTCLNRLETTRMQISLYSNDFSQFTRQLDIISDTLLYSVFSLTNRKLLNIDETSLTINEPEQGIYQGIYQYEVITEKARN